MRLVHIANRPDPLAAMGAGAVAPLAPLAGVDTIDDLLTAGPGRWAEVAELAERALTEGGALPLDGVELAAPLLRPSKIACIGLNYDDHCRETGLDRPERPLLFAKFPSSLVGPGAAIAWPAGLTEQVDWEAELAVVVGSRMSGVDVAEALDHVFGYTAANDISARDLQFGDGQWVRGKTLDTFCPLGPSIVTSEEFGDPQSKRILCRVDGEVKQDSSTAEMIFGVAEILSFLSHNFTLEPGDLVLTGTPWGVGGFADPPCYLEAGQTVEVEVEGIGVLANPVAGPTPIGAPQRSGAA